MRSFTFSLFMASLAAIFHVKLVYAAHPTNSADMTAQKVMIIESALEALLRDHEHELAGRFINHHLDGTLQSSRFLHLVVMNYLR